MRVGTFSEALYALRYGERVRRAGWNGKGMWLGLIRYSPPFIMAERVGITVGDQEPSVSTNCLSIRMEPSIMMKTADDKFVPWLASQTDVLADDWEVAE